MKTRSLLIAGVILALFAAACSSAGGREAPGSLNSADDLIAALEGQGISG